MNLPGDYRKVTSETPILGAPLPGDLGGPILERQRQLGLEPGSTTGMTPAEQAAEAERQRIAAQARQAREAGVMIRSAGGSPAASIASALGSAPTPSAPDEIGRASCRERGCQYVEIAVGAGTLKTK